MNLQLFDQEPFIVKKEEDESFIETSPGNILHFELFPAVALLGRNAMNTENNELSMTLLQSEKRKKPSKTLRDVFGAAYTTDTHHFDVQLTRFIEQEAKKMKIDSKKRLRGENVFSYEEAVALFNIGADVLLEQGKNPMELLQLLIEKKLSCEPFVMKHSRLGRYIINGFHDRFWYEETGKMIDELFPNFDKGLICDLLAATSVRASIEANTKKFLQALHHFFLDETVVKVMRQAKGMRYEIATKFPKQLDAVTIVLNRIYGGESLYSAQDMKNATKIKNFSKAIFGDPNAIPVDIWIVRSHGCDSKHLFRGRMVSKSPSNKLYNAIHSYLCSVAEVAHFEPRQVSASIWSGLRSETSKSKTTTFGPLLEKTFNHGLFSDIFDKNLTPGQGVSFLPKNSSI